MPNLGIASLHLTPQETFLYQHHLNNLERVGKGGGIINADGSISTIKNITREIDGKTYIFPTIWDGKELPVPEATMKAQQAGFDKWPSYKSQDEADKRYDAMHKFMDQQVGLFGNKP